MNRNEKMIENERIELLNEIANDRSEELGFKYVPECAYVFIYRSGKIIGEVGEVKKRQVLFVPEIVDELFNGTKVVKSDFKSLYCDFNSVDGVICDELFPFMGMII
jgi:hypothetical protein